MDLVRQHAVLDHVSVIDARGGFLLPAGIGVAMQRRVSVAGHMPHVRDTRRTLAAVGRGIERAAIGFVIPEMNAGVLNRM